MLRLSFSCFVALYAMALCLAGCGGSKALAADAAVPPNAVAAPPAPPSGEITVGTMEQGLAQTESAAQGSRGEGELAGSEPTPAPASGEQAPPATAPDPAKEGSGLEPTPASQTSTAAQGQPPQQGTSPAAPASAPVKAGTMLDIEAWLRIEVESVTTVVVRVRELVQRSGGTVAEEQVSDHAPHPAAELLLRIPAQSSTEVLEALSRFGTVRERQVKVKDVGKEYYDATIRLENLELLRRRYERILERADRVEDILRIEQELNSVRERIELLKGELRWLRDRVARATVHLSLVGPENTAQPIGHPKAKLYPGLRGHYLADFWRGTGDAGYMGAGASIRVMREFSLDLDGLRDVTLEGHGLDVVLVTLGGEFYSDFLGGGRRTWFNPYLGFRGGYARFLDKNEFLAGGTLGLEVFKARACFVDVESRFMGLLGGSEGAHLAIQPGVGFNVAF